MFIRGGHADAVQRQLRRGDGDGFTFGDHAGLCEAVVMANADRVVELFLALTDHLPPAVSAELGDVRTSRVWRGDGIASAEVRDALARMKGTLATQAGVEVTLTGSDDQLTLTPNLELFVYARTDRWLYLLQGKGLRRRATLHPRSWRLGRDEFAPAPAVAIAVREAAERVGLVPVRDGGT